VFEFLLYSWNCISYSNVLFENFSGLKPNLRRSRKMGKNCIVENCYGGTKRFQFPKDEKMRNIWIDRLNLHGKELIKCSYVCELHFDEKFLGTGRLRDNAIPNCSILYEPISIREKENDTDIAIAIENNNNNNFEE